MLKSIPWGYGLLGHFLQIFVCDQKIRVVRQKVKQTDEYNFKKIDPNS